MTTTTTVGSHRYEVDVDETDDDRLSVTVVGSDADGQIVGELTGVLPATDLAAIARRLARGTGPALDLASIRRKYPNAYQPWTAVADRQLMEKYQNGTTVAELADHFGRHRNAIRTRLTKLGIDPDGPRGPGVVANEEQS
ncbi:hypothetical protein [Tenggerimyces flavus]|uniref:Uncharacterized protein n=1 Tax=Tenggerimyces flavus TaxID=1708749 RepID=A0ABV7Y516_9ACTN|nr:hypothetical protein [Tenggerimyces flavus]MBM7788645.1 hypothetical protein [Tenggerimyces flavus]